MGKRDDATGIENVSVDARVTGERIQPRFLTSSPPNPVRGVAEQNAANGSGFDLEKFLLRKRRRRIDVRPRR